MNGISTIPCLNQNSTIFKTINGDLTLFNKTLIATKDNLRSLETVNATVYNKHGVFNLEGLTTSATKSVSSFTKLSNAFKAYNGNLSKSTQLQTAYIKAVGNQNSALGNYLAGLNGAKASMSGYIKSLVAAKAASIGLQVASIALNTAITMGVSLAISALVSQISKWIHAQEEARQKSVELTNSYKEQQSSLDSQIEKYKELKETLDKGNLSTDESRSIKEQLLEIQQSLIESYGDEASNIDLVNGKYREQLGLLSELSKEKATDYVTENRDVFADVKEALEKIRTYNLGTVTSWNTYAPETEDQKRLIEYLETYSDLLDLTYSGASGRGVTATSVSLSVKADVENADEIMHQLAEDLEKYGKDNNIDVSGLLEGISGQLKKTWTDELTEYKTVYDEFMKAEIVRNDTLRPLYQESIKAVEDYNNALSTGEGVEEAKANLDSVQQSVQNATGELEGSQDVFDGIYDGINKDAEAAYNLGQAFANDKTVQEYAEQLRGLSDIDLKAINFDNDNTEKGEEAFRGLMETLGLTEEQVQSLIDKLVELGYVQGEVQGSTLNETNIPSYDTLSESAESASKSVDTLRSSISSINDAFSEHAENGSISVDTMLSLVDAGYATALQFDEATGACTINKEAMLDLVKAKIQNQIADLQTLQTDIASKLKDDGIIASESADGFIKLAKSKAAVATAEQLSSVHSFNAAEAQIKALENAIANLDKIGSGSYSTKFKSVTKSVAEDAEKTTKEYIESYMDFQKKSLEAGKIDYNTYCNTVSNLLKSMFKDGKIAAKDYHDYTKEMLTVQKSIYDKAISGMVYILDREIDRLDEEKKLIESNYQTKIDAIQAEIDALNEANDARQEQIDLEKAQYELEKAQNQRVNKVYNGEQFVYKTDTSAIRDAKDEVAQRTNDIKISQLESQIKSLEDAMESETKVIDDQIAKYEEYKEQIQDVADAYENAENVKYALAVTGLNSESEILQCRTDTLNTFKDNYIAIQQAIADAAWASANEQIKAAKEAAKGADGNTGTSKVNNIVLDKKTPQNVTKKITGSGGKYASKVFSPYASGTKNAKPGWHPVSEDGYGDEIILTNDGDAVVANGEQLYPFEGGEVVIKASETEKILGNMGNLEPLQTGDIWKKFADNVPDLSSMVKLDIPDYSKIGSMLIKNNTSQPNVTIGDIHLHEVQNVTDFAQALQKHLPNISVQYNGRH